MKLRQIEVFFAIMKSGTVSGAARNLNVSQPNVTRVLAHTEQQLGFSLFERVKGRLVPTPEAHCILPEAEAIYERLGGLQSLTRQLRKGGNHLRLVTNSVLSTSVLAPVIREFTTGTKNTIEVDTYNRDGMVSSLLHNRADLAISFDNRNAVNIVCRPLISAPFKVIVPKGSFTEASLTLEAVIASRYNLISLDARDPAGQVLNSALQTYSSEIKSQINVRCYMTAAELVSQGAGIAVIDSWTAGLFENKVDVLTLDEDLLVSVSLMYAEHTPLGIAATRFTNILTDTLSR